MTKIKELVEAFSPESNISPEKMQEWCDMVDRNYSKFKGKNWAGIYQVLDSFEIVGVEEQIKRMSASAIADSEGAEMNTEENACTLFFAYAKKNMK